MKIININVKSGSYPVFIGEKLSRSGQAARTVNKGGKAVVVADGNVAPLYAETVLKSFEKAGYKSDLHIIPSGEENKNLSTVESIYKAFHRQGLTRKDIAAALGGGVAGDMTGFAAGTYLRGMDCVQIPTTLLAQVDSSVGGKTGVDMPWGKNLVGVFHQPAAVITDPDTLLTLSPALVADGMAEAVKCGCIRNESLFYDMLEGRCGGDKTDMITACVDIKRRIVEEDERESGMRMLLNFGHTIGHALEKAGEYKKYTHGQAVAAGMLRAAALGEKLGITTGGTRKIIEKALSRWNLSDIDESSDVIYKGITADKKREDDFVHFVFLEKIGKAVIVPLGLDDIKKHLT